MTQHSIYTIAPDQPFVDVLAKALLARAGQDPMALARMRVLLPTRRAIRSLREAFLRLSGGQPLLLPQMQPVGDVDEEEMLLTGLLGAGAEGGNALPPVMPPARRILLLASLIWRYHRLEYGPTMRMDQAVHLAKELASLLDEAAREELPLERLHGIVPQELAGHWQVTLDFLQIIMTHWPRILEEEGRLDPVNRRNALLHLLAAHWQAHPPAYPVIAAGTTGSIPATAALLKVICGLPQGMVVLPGWDTAMPEELWEALEAPAQQVHPHYGMRHLLGGLGVPREAVKELAAAEEAPRVAMLKAAFAPAEQTAQWHHHSLDWRAALQGFRRIDCATVQEEATVIALLLRDAVQVPGKTAALVTPDRGLARRVAAVLRRFHVVIDDSAGVPLADTPSGVLLQLLADVASSRAAPVPLLALLKHPLVRMGRSAAECRQLARLLERGVLRGLRPQGGNEELVAGVMASRQLPEKKKESVICFAEWIFNALAPMLDLFAEPTVELAELIRAHVQVAEAITRPEDGQPLLWQGEEGEQLSQFLGEMLAAVAGVPCIEPVSYPGTLGALMAGRVWRPQHGLHPRLHILSPMEARLQLFDRIILGGLNEGTWPADVGQDPWMSRPMRSGFGLPLPERQTGLSAHDFYSLANAPEVVVTRAEKAGGSPTVPSRWLLRIEALLGALGGEEARRGWLASGGEWAHWARELDRAAIVQSCLPPAPRPPVAARPRTLYVTHIETLLRNPYGLYASKVLGLRQLDPLDQEPGLREFGTLLHDVIERYINSPKQTLEELMEIGRRGFDELMSRPLVRTFWWPRFQRIAEWLAEEEAARRAAGIRVEAEQEGVMRFAAPAGDFALKAFIDRVEWLDGGGIRLIDYKAGSVPSVSDMRRGLAPQLLLEAVIARHGTIGGKECRHLPVDDLQYWKLRGGRSAAEITSMREKAGKDEGGLEEWIARAYAGILALIAAYDDGNTPYPYAPVAADKPKYDDFEHLARVREWGVGE